MSQKAVAYASGNMLLPGDVDPAHPPAAQAQKVETCSSTYCENTVQLALLTHVAVKGRAVLESHLVP